MMNSIIHMLQPTQTWTCFTATISGPSPIPLIAIFTIKNQYMEMLVQMPYSLKSLHQLARIGWQTLTHIPWLNFQNHHSLLELHVMVFLFSQVHQSWDMTLFIQSHLAEEVM